MTKHKTEDYKISAVKYYLNNDRGDGYKKPIDKQTEMNAFYKEIKHYPLNKIICLDETSVGSALHPTYSRCYLGRRCRIKTSNQFVFRKFTLLVAISNSKIVVKIDEKYFRPCEVDFLLGDATKAETELGWTREYDLDDLIDDMMK